MRLVPLMARCSDWRSVRSPTTTSAPSSRRFSARSSSRRTRARTLWPLASNMATTLRPMAPMSPAAPVTRMGLSFEVFMGMSFCGVRSEDFKAACGIVRRPGVAFMEVRRRGAIDQEAQQFGAVVVTDRVHQQLATVDQGEIEVGDDFAFALAEWLADQHALRRDDGREAAPGDRADRATGVLHDLRLLVGIEPGGRIHHETARLQGVLADVDFHALREALAEGRARIHGGVDLLAIGHHGVAGERVVVLEAGQMADSPDLGIRRAQPRAIALTPDHAFEMCRRDLATALYERAVGIEEQLRVVDGAAIALVDADGNHHVGFASSLGNRIRGGGGDGHGLLQQAHVFLA